jgi:hypothetical protein
MGRGAIVKALLEGGADPTIATNACITRQSIALAGGDTEGYPICVRVLEVSSCLPLVPSLPSALALVISWLRCGVLLVLGMVDGRRRSGPTCSVRPGRWPSSRERRGGR